MLDFDKLNILDSAQEVSDELLAAYIDGNTTDEENLFVEQHLPAEEIDTMVETTEDCQSFQEYISVWDGDYGLWELGLPPVLTHDGEINTLNQWKDSPMENNLLLNPFILGKPFLVDMGKLANDLEMVDNTIVNVEFQQFLSNNNIAEIAEDDLLSNDTMIDDLDNWLLD